MPTTAYYFIQSAMTRFTASIFPYRSRVSLKEAFEGLEPDEAKVSRPVLRGPGLSNGVWLLGLMTAQAVGAASHTPGEFSIAVRIGCKPVSSRS